MISLATDFRAAMVSGTNSPVELVEIAFEGGATYYFGDQAITWNGHAYQPYVVSRSAIKRYMNGQFDQVSVTFSNVDTGMAQFIAVNDVEGATLIIRLVFPTITDDSLPLFVGLIQRPGAVDEKQCVLMALERLGSMQMDAPTRTFSARCPWPYKGDECLATSSNPTCDQSWANCVANTNTDHYGGFRFLPAYGTFQYQQTTESTFLLLFKRQKTTNVTVAFNSVDDTPYDTPIPIVLGRAQIQGIPIEHEDTGTQTNSLIAFCVGTISQYVFTLCNNTLLDFADDATIHTGQIGGTASQLTDPRFTDSYPYTLVAYLGITLPSSVTAVDGAPAVVSTIMGMLVDFFDSTGAWSTFGWSDNPIWNTREFLTLSYYEGGMGVPWGWMDDARNYAEAEYCNELVSDTTNDQQMFLPDPMPDGLVAGVNYRTFQSTGVDGYDPTTDGPYVTYDPGVTDDSSQSPTPVNVKRFTMNAAIAQQDSAIDILQQKLLPSFRGYTKSNKLGQIQICVEKANPNALVTANAVAGVTSILVDNPSQFNPGDLLILSTFTVNAEMGTVASTTGTTVVLTAATAKPHAIGDEFLKVSRAFTDSNIADNTVIQYPLSDRQTTINRISVKYVDSPTGFVPVTLQVNDFDNQAKVHAVNNQDLDGGAIDSYFQAWRIGEWQLALMRDLGKFVSLRTGIGSSDLEIGDDIIAVSAPEHGLVCVPFRIVEMGFTSENEVDLVGQLYSTGVYNDTAPQSTRTVPAIFSSATTGVDIGVPPAPICGVAAVSDGTVTFSPISFATSVDTTGITSAIIVLLYADQTTPATALLSLPLFTGVTAGTAITLYTDRNLTGIVFAGDWLLIGGEMLYVTADATSANVACERALGLTVAEGHGINAPIKRLNTAIFTYAFPVGFFGGGNAPMWGPTETLPNAGIALMNIEVFNAPGGSPQGPINYSQAMSGLLETGNNDGGQSVYAVPIVAGIATPDASMATNVLTLTPATGDITVGQAVNYGTLPGRFTNWDLIIEQDPAGSTGGHQAVLDASYFTTVNAGIATAASPNRTHCHLQLKTSSSGNSSLRAQPAIDEPIGV